MNCSCNGNWSCLSVSAPYSQENRVEQRRSQNHRLNGMLKCQGLGPGLLVPQVRAATVRLHCLIPCWSWQKESSMKNAAGASRGISKNDLAKLQAWQAVRSFGRKTSSLMNWYALFSPFASWFVPGRHKKISGMLMNNRGSVHLENCRVSGEVWLYNLSAGGPLPSKEKTKVQQIAVAVWSVYVAYNIIGMAY